jgi:hypothetical protein
MSHISEEKKYENMKNDVSELLKNLVSIVFGKKCLI